jgi:hypothetical protein
MSISNERSGLPPSDEAPAKLRLHPRLKIPWGWRRRTADNVNRELGEALDPRNETSSGVGTRGALGGTCLAISRTTCRSTSCSSALVPGGRYFKSTRDEPVSDRLIYRDGDCDVTIVTLHSTRRNCRNNRDPMTYRFSALLSNMRFIWACNYSEELLLVQ